jgi:hypothetical protein
MKQADLRFSYFCGCRSAYWNLGCHEVQPSLAGGGRLYRVKLPCEFWVDAITKHHGRRRPLMGYKEDRTTIIKAALLKLLSNPARHVWTYKYKVHSSGGIHCPKMLRICVLCFCFFIELVRLFHREGARVNQQPPSTMAPIL